jgi:membrane fusion protein (multidrug efflux system)
MPLSNSLRGRVFLRVLLLVIVPIAAAMVGAYWYALGGRYVSTDNAYVKANMVAISSSIDGRVASVPIRDNEVVSEGDVLFTLDPRPHAIALERAEARLDAVINEVAAIQAEYAQIGARVADAKERVTYLKRQHQRQQELTARGMGTAANFDEAQYEVTKAVHETNALKESARQVLAQLGGRPNVAALEHPSYLESLATRNEAELALDYTVVRAPTNGIVSRMRLQPGEWVEEGRTVFQLIETGELWVEANLKETQLTHVEVGQRVDFEVDAYPGVPWRGSVSHISPATGSEFMVLPAQNATGNWVKVVQRIPIRIDIDAEDRQPALRAGMTVEVVVDTRRERELLGMMRAAMGTSE